MAMAEAGGLWGLWAGAAVIAWCWFLTVWVTQGWPLLLVELSGGDLVGGSRRAVSPCCVGQHLALLGDTAAPQPLQLSVPLRLGSVVTGVLTQSGGHTAVCPPVLPFLRSAAGFWGGGRGGQDEQSAWPCWQLVLGVS